MAEDDLSNVVGGPEEIGFKLTFECSAVNSECIRFFGWPEGGSSRGNVVYYNILQHTQYITIYYSILKSTTVYSVHYNRLQLTQYVVGTCTV